MEDDSGRRLKFAQCADPEVLLVTGFASGFLRPAPGTWGSLAALAIWWWLLAPSGWGVQLLVIAATFALGSWLVDRVGRRHGVGDDATIVVDEFVGLWLALLAVPATLWAALAGFLLFRLFDIWKPWPIRLADRRVGGGFGVMLDDLLAGVAAGIVLQVALWLFGASPWLPAR